MKQTGSGHLRWVIVLLCAVVVLPTVCLLWFMNQAVRNERLAVRQRLVDFYTERAGEVFSEYGAKGWGPEKAVGIRDGRFQGMVIYDANGVIEYPVLGVEAEMEGTGAMERAWGLEFVEKEYEKAAAAYSEIADSNDAGVCGAAIEGKARSLRKAGRLSEAAGVYGELAWPEGEREVEGAAAGRARVAVMRLYQSLAHPEFFAVCQKVLDGRFADLEIGSETKVFLLRQCVEIAEKAGLCERLPEQIEEAQKTTAREELSLLAAERYPNDEAFAGWDEGTFRSIGGEEPLYAIYYVTDGKRVMGVVDSAKMKAFWGAAVKDMEDETVFCRVLNDAGRITAGMARLMDGTELVLGQRFLSQDLGGAFPGWKAELYLFDGTFGAAANRQQLVYLWTAGLVIGLMVVVAGLAGKTILHEAKLNRLKNDFIATVSHELKTPLASTRVLVDTLLEGNYKDEGTVKEYLELVSRENERLTRLIENFLSFSRMERNKQAFDMQPVEAGEIARASAEAVRAKFEMKNCEFSVTVEEPGASITADRDAMVTVLVNLLDNACKYTGEEKRIGLRVYCEDGQVCFAVKDNGIGMSKRQVKRVFDRFFQADSSLARRAEGCGLGLAIVKFIVDAHKGAIDVESKVGEGSEFVVKIPVCEGQ